LPQDSVAIFAFNRASDFTNDHRKVVDILERFKRSHERIESRLDLAQSGLAAIYGNKGIPAPLQSEVDALFGAPGDHTAREVPRSLTPDGEIADPVLSGRMVDVIGTRMSLGSYVELSPRTVQDLGNLYTAIDYLRYLEGQKHIIFVTEHGISLPNGES